MHWQCKSGNQDGARHGQVVSMGWSRDFCCVAAASASVNERFSLCLPFVRGGGVCVCEWVCRGNERATSLSSCCCWCCYWCCCCCRFPTLHSNRDESLIRSIQLSSNSDNYGTKANCGQLTWHADWQIWWQIHVQHIHIYVDTTIYAYIFSGTASVLPLRLNIPIVVVLLIMCVLISSPHPLFVSLQPLSAALWPPIHQTPTKKDPSSSRNPPIASTSQTQLAPKLNASQVVTLCLKLSGSAAMVPP